MPSINDLLNDKYEFLKYMHDHCIVVDDEFVLMDTTETIVTNTSYSQRTLARVINKLEDNGFIKESSIKKSRYPKLAFTDAGLRLFKKIDLFVTELEQEN